MEKSDQWVCEEDGADAKQKPQGCGHPQGGGRKGGCLLCPAGSQGVACIYLSAHFRQGCQPIGEPHVHTRGSHGSHGAAPHPSDPEHVRQIVSHLDERGCHDGQSQSCQGRQHRAVYEIDIFSHDQFLRCIYISVKCVRIKRKAPARHMCRQKIL